MNNSIQYMEWNKFSKYTTWHNDQKYYGKAMHIPGRILLLLVILLCLATPGTNWLIPLLATKAKKGYTIRWN